MKELFLFVFVVLLVACSSRSGDRGLLEEAFEIHTRAVLLADTLEKELMTLENRSDVNRDSVIVLKHALEEWKKNLVEVPGHEHDHDHVQLHKHADLPEVTDHEALLIQQALMEQLEGLEKRVRGIGLL